MRKLISIGFLLIFTIGEIIGQTLANIDTIVVLTTRLPLKANETGRNISVVEGEAIRDMAANSMDELLQYLPGIEVQSRNGFGAQGDISMRGSTFSQVLILVDGMKMHDPLTAHFNGYIPVTPAEIERIEVLKGAASAMYGADAVGGVINIITKGFSKNQQEISEGFGEINFGEHKLISAQQGFSIRKRDHYIGGGFSINQSDGEFFPARQIGNTNLEAYGNYFNIKTFGVTYAKNIDPYWRLVVRTAYDDRDYNARYFYTTSPFDKSTEKTRNWWNHLSLSKQSEHSLTDFHLAYRFGTDEFIFSPDFASTNLHSTHFLNATFNQLHFIDDVFSINYGGQIDRRSIASTDRGDHGDWHFGGYAMGNIRAGRRANLSLSMRLDHDENYGLEFTPQINFSYVLPGLILRASAGRTIRAADYTERFVSYNLENLTPGRSLGNPGLEAESAWSAELGADFPLTSGWKIKLTGFERNSENLIDYVSTNEAEISNNQNLQEGADYFYATNIANVNTKGFELESWLTKDMANDIKLQWVLGYTHLHTGNEDDIVSVYISSHAKHYISTNFTIKSPIWNIALSGIYKNRSMRISSDIDAFLDPSYQLWNFKLGYRLSDELGLNFQIHNVFDKKYQDILGAPMPGRWIMGGVGVKW